MMVRFATTCDAKHCTNRSDEYTAWPTCRSCGDHFCPAHWAIGSLLEGDGDGPDTIECRACRAEADYDASLALL